MGRGVWTPCPISECPHQILTAPSGAISSQAFGAKEEAEEGAFTSGEKRAGRWNPRTSAPPVAAEDLKNERRVSVVDSFCGSLRNQTLMAHMREQSVLQVQDSLSWATRFGFDAAPTYGSTADGFLHGAEEDHVHQLAIVEALQEDGDEQRPIFFFLESERKRAGEDIDQQETEKEDDGFLDVGGGPELRQFRDAELRKTPEYEGAEEHQVDDWGNQRQHQLKNKDIGQCDPAEGAVLRTEERVAVLPERLQRAKGPAETLANQSACRFRGFRPSDGFFVVTDTPSEAANSDGEVGVFRDGIRGDATGGFNGLLTPGAERAGDDRNAV